MANPKTNNVFDTKVYIPNLHNIFHDDDDDNFLLLENVIHFYVLQSYQMDDLKTLQNQNENLNFHHEIHHHESHLHQILPLRIHHL
jgi:hypothetical protein